MSISFIMFICDKCHQEAPTTIATNGKIELPSGWTIWCAEKPLQGFLARKHFCNDCKPPCECPECTICYRSPQKWKREHHWSADWISLRSQDGRWTLSIPRYGPVRATLYGAGPSMSPEYVAEGSNTMAYDDLQRIQIICDWADQIIAQITE